MNLLDKKWPLSALGLLLLSSANVNANNCAEQSPLKVQLGDEYIAQELGYSDIITIQQTTNNELRQNKAIITGLTDRSFKRGTGVRYVCKGSGDNVRLETTEFDLEDLHWTKSLNGNMALKAWENSERKTTHGSITIAPAQIWNVTDDNAATSIILTRTENPYLNTRLNFVYDNNLNLNDFGLDDNYLYEKGSVYKPPSYERENLLDFPDRSGYYLKEIRTEIKRSGKRVTLRRSIFVNGQRAELVVWDLLS